MKKKIKLFLHQIHKLMINLEKGYPIIRVLEFEEYN